MGVLFAFTASKGKSSSNSKRGEVSLKTMHQFGCKICPLNFEKNLKSPKMSASGAENPLVYIIGEAPSKQEDEADDHFLEDSSEGDLIRNLIPRSFRKSVRWNNTINCRPPKDRHPEKIEVECCRPRLIDDIQAARPKLIIGLGTQALKWFVDFSQAPMYLWRGRLIPVKVGDHKCWFLPTFHPSDLLPQRKQNQYTGEKEKSLDELSFALDIRWAFDNVEDLPDAKPHDPSEADRGITCITGKGGDTDLDRVLQFLTRAGQSAIAGLDLETKNLRPYGRPAELAEVRDPQLPRSVDEVMADGGVGIAAQTNSKILTVAISLGWDDTMAFAWDHPEAGWTSKQRAELERAYIKYLKSKCRKVVHNLAFEQEWHAFMFGGEEILRAGPWEDTTSQASILDERFSRKYKPGPLSLEWLVMQHFGFNLKALGGHVLDKDNLDKERLIDVLRYNGMDAKYHRGLFLRQDEKIAKDELLDEGYEVKLRQVPTCVLTQIKGVPTDASKTSKLDLKYAERISQIEHELFDMRVIQEFERKHPKKERFKPGSQPHVEFFLHDILHTKIGAKDSGKYDTDANTLREVGHPACLKIIEWREATKIRSTYVSPYKRLYPDGLLHCLLNTVFTETSRLSCNDPNLQNQIKRKKEAKEIRSQIRVPKGYVGLAFDYGQIEFRVLAMASKDPTVTRMIWERYDVHGEWCQRIAKRYPAWIKEPMHEFLAGANKNASDAEKGCFKRYRDLAKNQFVFPLCFGAGITKISNELGITAENIKPEIDSFWRTFVGVGDWHDRENKFYQKNGFVETLSGHFRRRHPLTFNELINLPIQGTAAEILMNAYCELSEMGDPHLQPILQIHDDLEFLVPEKDAVKYAEKIADVMLDVKFDFVNVPINVEAGLWKTWDKVEAVGEYNSDIWQGWPERPRYALAA